MTHPKLFDRIVELKIASGRLSLEVHALEESMGEIARTFGVDDVRLMADIKRRKNVLWGNFLEALEKRNPAMAARIDERSIDEVLTAD